MNKFKKRFSPNYWIALRRVWKHFIPFRRCYKVDLSDLNLKRLPLLVSFVNMNELNAAGNQLSYLPPFFGRFRPRIMTVDLSDNCFTTIPEELFNIAFLSHLYIGGNQIKEIPKSIEQASLSYLGLCYNELETIPEFICKMHSLYTLDVRGNIKITTVPENIGKMLHLSKLHLENTSIQQLPQSLADGEFDASHNRSLLVLPGNFADLEHPRYLVLGRLSLPLEVMNIPKNLDFLPAEILLGFAIAEPNERQQLIQKFKDEHFT